MKRHILISVIAAIVIAAGVAGMSAFEAHVVNVTAHIENALSVIPEGLEYGTVFPQEKLNSHISVSLSESFSAMDQDRVGNVDYVIKQRPKPRPQYANLIGAEAAQKWCFDNYPETEFVPASQEWTAFLQNCYPSLCPYLSKHPDNIPAPGNDSTVAAFHDPFDPANYFYGKLLKFGPSGTTINNDPADIITIDLDVPCFQGQCAQDWSHSGWELPKDLESETFGCDLLVEVTNID